MNVSMENFVNNVNDLLDKHAPFKKSGSKIQDNKFIQ